MLERWTERRGASRSASLVWLLLLLAVVASGCRVAADEVAVERLPPPFDASSLQDDELLPIVGPIPGSSHWHAAYVVRVCDDVLPPFESADDPLGIHSHGDGLMHVHPFFEESGYEAARLGHFADAMGFELRDGELVLPNGDTYRDGDLCGDRPGRVFVDRWRSPDPTSDVERIFDDLDQIRYLADGELYQIGFAPSDSLPVVPPSTPLLSEVSNFVTPAEPWIDTAGLGPSDPARLWKIDAVGQAPCDAGALPERVLFGPVRCFTEAAGAIDASEAVLDARAVTFNRQPAVELQMAEPLIDLILDHFRNSDNPLALAIEVDGSVITAPQIVRPPVSGRLVVTGGFSVETARELAAALAAS